MHVWSPSHDQVPEDGEESIWQWLGEHVTQLIFGAHSLHSDLWVTAFGV